MKKELKSLGKQTVIYGAGSMLSRLSAFLLLPVYTNYLTPAQFGTLEIFYMSTAVISIFLGTQLSHAALRFYFDYDTERGRYLVISSSFILYFCFSAVVLGACALFSGQFSRLLFSTSEYTTHFVVLFVWLLFSLSNEIFFAFVRALERARFFVVIMLLELLIKIVLCIVFVVEFQWAELGVLAGNLAGTGTAFVVLFVFTFSRCTFEVDVPLSMRLVRYTLPLIFVSMCGTAMSLADRFFLKTYTSLAMVGIYALGMRFANVVNFLIFHPFTKGYGPFRFSIMKKDNAPDIYSRVTTYFCFFFLWACLGVIAWAREVIVVMADQSYWGSYQVVPVLVVSVFFSGLYYMVQIGVYLKKNTRVLSYVFAAAAFFNLVCLWLLVPAFGIMGAALSVCVTRVLVVLLGLYCSQLVYPIQYEWARCLKIGVVFLALSIAASLQLSDNPYLSALMKMPVVLAYPIALFALNFFSPQEIGFVLKIPARMISAGEVRRNIS